MPHLPPHIWHLYGPVTDGPRVTILGGTHGDEQGGIAVVRLLLKTLNLMQKPSGSFCHPDVRGHLFIGFGNTEAMLRDTRSASDGRDLNRSFVPDEIVAKPASDDRLDLVRARELTPLFAQTDVLLDIHSTSSPSEPFVCFSTLRPKHRHYLPLFPVRYILHDPDLVYVRHEGAHVAPTTDSEIERHGGIGFCYETGLAQDTTVAPQILANLLPILEATNVVTKKFRALFDLPTAQPRTSEQTMYAIREPIIMKKSGFTYAPGMNHGWQQIVSDQLIGAYPDCEEIRSPRDGMYVFPRALPRLTVDKAIVWIAERCA